MAWLVGNTATVFCSGVAKGVPLSVDKQIVLILKVAKVLCTTYRESCAVHSPDSTASAQVRAENLCCFVLLLFACLPAYLRTYVGR